MNITPRLFSIAPFSICFCVFTFYQELTVYLKDKEVNVE